jgi:iron complex transport system permease protein
MKSFSPKRFFLINGLLLFLLVLVLFVSANLGPTGLSLFGGGRRALEIIKTARLPRLLAAVVSGAALGSTGTSFQALLRNPLADPYILGVSGGAALGAVLAMIAGLPWTAVISVSFVSAFLSMLVIYWVAVKGGRLLPHTLLLTGVIFNTFSFALIMFINSILPSPRSHDILFLLLGNLDVYEMGIVGMSALFVFVGLLILCIYSWNMNLLSLGDESAASLGVDVEATRRAIFFTASIMVGASVSLAGLIGFVGLFVPHILRLAIGPDHRILVPASSLLGAISLVLADTLVRSLGFRWMYATELPVGVITALFGAPFFIFLLKRGVT